MTVMALIAVTLADQIFFKCGMLLHISAYSGQGNSSTLSTLFNSYKVNKVSIAALQLWSRRFVPCLHSYCLIGHWTKGGWKWFYTGKEVHAH
ncbi:hypothetical protein XELAEV_18026986mg [Xenopus laevis]|uniref:Uncharacterized protein n=1 Tax=Xenopus laevis TaxID=8355 RepID=A0A974CXB2_XENLA|nr:hypothetical protein XELAEV_18026986mg [Xenopus laevis]